MLKEGAIHYSTAMRHIVELTQQIQETVRLRENTMMPFAFLIRSDGDNDRNPKNMTTILSSIYTFLENDLDFLIHLVTVAETSYINEVEGIMLPANVILQNQVYAREKVTDDMEKSFKFAGSRKTIRDISTKSLDGKENNEALES